MLRLLRYGAWAAVAALAFVTVAVGSGWFVVDGPGARRVIATGPASLPIGGPFTLTDQRGRAVTERDFRGRPMAVFFGFTHCPDICPTTLGEFAAYMEALGPDADRLHWLFITVDSERDTPEHLARYMELFDPRVVALTGTEAQVAQAARNFRVTYRRVPLDGGGYTIDHSASTFLLDAQGRFAGTIDFKEPDHIAIEKLRLLLRRPAT
ncbi:SCO family protein [Roseococcus sp. SDR]|nr:SCO family protein [Roseococcus sp. SDR]MBV1844667.1 SCO family protein [Roseococcus sp. SDR]